MAVSLATKRPAFELGEFNPDVADELAHFLNELRGKHWTLTSSAYQRKPAHIAKLTGDGLLKESSEHPHRIGHYLLRHNNRIVASLKIDDKFGDGRVAVLSDLEVHPDFQRRGILWFHFRPCLRRVIESDFEMLEGVTWVFNRKGIPLYKRLGFRAVPGTSLLMENFMPMIIPQPALRAYFQRNDYFKTLVNQRSYGYDHLEYQDLSVFHYRWQAEAETWDVLVDFQRRQLALIACLQWSFSAWVVQDNEMHIRVRIENRDEDEISCDSLNFPGVRLAAIRGETKQAEWEVGNEVCVGLSVRAGRQKFPFLVKCVAESPV